MRRPTAPRLPLAVTAQASADHECEATEAHRVLDSDAVRLMDEAGYR